MSTGYAAVGWSVRDVVDLVEDAGGAISEEQAREFLENNSRHIQDAMVERGWEAINTLLHMEGLLK